VESSAVVEGFNVIEDGGTSLDQGGEATVVNKFVFEAAPERLNEGIVVAVTLASHGGEQSMLSQEVAVRGAGELGAAIGVKDEGFDRTTLSKRHA